MTYSKTMKNVLRSTSLIALSSILLAACASSGSQPSTPGAKQAQNSKSAIGQKFDAAFEQSLNEARNTDDPAQAALIYEELMSIRPNDPVIATQYARSLRNDDQLAKAKNVLAKFTSGDNANPEALTELAMVHLSMGEFKEAELKSRETITKLPENGRAFLALGTALDAQKYHEQAETAFRRGIEYWDGDPAPILNNLALNLASQGKLDEAISVLARARETSPHRMEIERNYRIISTLRETTGPRAPKPSAKPDAPKTTQPVDIITPSNDAKRPQPILENDPAVKAEEKTQSNDDVPVVEAEDTKSMPNEPVASNPRSIQKWKR